MIKCNTCSATIPPEFVHAIQTNTCPGCAGPIMADDTKALLDELSEAMEKMPNNPRGIAGWLVSNYRFQKIGEALPVDKFHQRPDIREQVEHTNLKIASNPFQQFLSKTDAYKGVQETQAKLAAINRNPNNKFVQLAESIATIDLEENITEGPEYTEENDDEYEAPMPRASRASRGLITGASLVDPNAAPLSHEELMALGTLAGNVGENSISKNHQKLEHFKRVKAQQEFMGGTGGFRRS